MFLHGYILFNFMRGGGLMAAGGNINKGSGKKRYGEGKKGKFNQQRVKKEKKNNLYLEL